MLSITLKFYLNKMAICEKCKKYPLEFREINEVENEKGILKVLCDDCYKAVFIKQYIKII
jgi:hypothetical protein